MFLGSYTSHPLLKPTSKISCFRTSMPSLANEKAVYRLDFPLKNHASAAHHHLLRLLRPLRLPHAGGKGLAMQGIHLQGGHAGEIVASSPKSTSLEAKYRPKHGVYRAPRPRRSPDTGLEREKSLEKCPGYIRRPARSHEVLLRFTPISASSRLALGAPWPDHRLETG